MISCGDRHAREHGATRLLLLVTFAVILVAAITLVEVSDSLPGWLMPLRRQTVDMLRWAKVNWLSTASVGVVAAIAGVLAPFVLRWLDRRHPMDKATEGRDAKQRAIMLRRVRYKWISGVLEPSLARAAQLVLGVERRPDLLDLGGARIVHRSGQRPEPLPADTPISKVFDMVGGGLLILGAPGGGKTTALLELCEDLLDRAEQDTGMPIPVVVNLASWGRHRPALNVWLVNELANGYQVPRRIAATWIEQDALTLLLDGLDEVAEAQRAACADAINAWRRDHGLVPVVVCSRTLELQALAPRLRLEEAVELQPPSDAEVDRYLSYLEATGTPLGDVREAVMSDPELRRLLRSPLLLHVVVLAYHGRPASALHAEGTAQQRQEWLWEAYLTRMFEQRPLDPADGYSDRMAMRWLTWLARSLQDHAETEFNLDRLDSEWLPTLAQRRRVRGAIGLAGGLAVGPVLGLAFALIGHQAFGLDFGPISGLVSGLVGGVGFGLVAGPVFGLSSSLPVDRRSRRQPHGGAMPNRDAGPSIRSTWVAVPFGLSTGLTAGLAGGLLGGLGFGLYAGVAVGLGCGLTSVLASSLSGGLSDRIEPTEQLRWSWTKLRSGLGRALIGGLVSALVFGPLYGLVGRLSAGLVFGLVLGLVVSLVGAMAAGLSGGLRDERVRPNEGIRRSVQYSLTAGLLGGLTAGLLGGLASGLALGSRAGLAAGLGFALMFAVTLALAFGGDACLQHVLVRAWLARDRVAPWRYGRFLEAMVQRLLLRRSGSAYLFVHRLLRDYLAGP
jgi:hypothetical protein